ncbi:MAG TPA: hypothetical protein PKX67_02915 [Anaerolineaceae bacterium]|nr:hypothetical protein [Anaerolineaceae bacterium]
MRIALAFVALCLPGLAWWLWLGDHKQDGGEALARIFAVSASVITLAALAFYTVRLKITPLAIGLLLSLFIGLVLTGLIHSWKTAFNKTWLIALFVLAIFTTWRIWQARELVFPNWVDSQHHVLIIRKIIENGGLPSTLEPYLPGPFYYHFAFHAVTAFFSVLSGLAPEQAVLMLGQVINACVGISVYALAKAMSKNWRVGVLAAFFVTFATKMPGYYLTWGRYTLLMGVTILPVAMAEVMQVKERHEHWWQITGLTLLTAGTLLSHYFAAFLLALFLALVGLQWLIESIRFKSIDWKPIASIAISTFIGLVLTSRWYYRIVVYSNATSRPVLRMMESGALEGSWEYLSYLVGPISGYILIGLGIVGLLWFSFKPKRFYLFGWVVIVLFLSLPTGLRLLNFRYDYYALVAFIPITITSAFTIVLASEKLINNKRISTLIIPLIGVLISVFGASLNLSAVNPETVLATKTDQMALDWIEAHTPEDARFFINTVGWSPNNYRGVDGGGWILPSTGRWSIVPTIFYPMSADEDFIQNTVNLGRRASLITDCGDDFWSLVNDAKLNYIYIKKGIGGLQPSALISCEGVRQLTNIGGVYIYLISETDNTP